MEEEFETAKAWVEKYEFCRFEGDIEEDRHFTQFIYEHIRPIEDELRRTVFNDLILIVANLRGYHIEMSLKGFDNKIIIANMAKEYRVLALRGIENQEVETLKEVIDKLNELLIDRKKLNELYKSIIINEFVSSSVKMQHHLGFVDIIRKSNHKLLYNFEKIDEERSYFSVIVTVKIAI